MSIDAVVVTYNSADTIRPCLASLKKKNISRIIVVDNASTDGTAAVLAQAGVEYIAQSSNTGFAHAANTAAARATADYILFLNPDAVLDSPLDPAEEYFKAQPTTAVLGFRLLTPENEPEKDNYGSAVTLWSLFTRHTVRTEVYQSAAEVGWVSGAALCVRRSVFAKLAGFDPDYFLYWEDVDLCRRVRDKGYSVVFLPSVVVMHQRGKSLKDAARKTSLYDRAADRYFQKHYSALICIFQRFLRKLYRAWRPQVR